MSTFSIFFFPCDSVSLYNGVLSTLFYCDSVTHIAKWFTISTSKAALVSWVTPLGFVLWLLRQCLFFLSPYSMDTASCVGFFQFPSFRRVRFLLFPAFFTFGFRFRLFSQPVHPVLLCVILLGFLLLFIFPQTNFSFYIFDFLYFSFHSIVTSYFFSFMRQYCFSPYFLLA